MSVVVSHGEREFVRLEPSPDGRRRPGRDGVRVRVLLDAHFHEDLERSGPIHPARWAHRSLRRRALEEAVGGAKRYF